LLFQFFGLKKRLFGPWGDGSPRIWFHGASLGECKMLIGVMKYLGNEMQKGGHGDPPLPTSILTTQKIEILGYLKKLADGICDVQMAPLDLPFVRRRFWRSANPQMLVLGENELWPGWLKEARLRKTPVALVSGSFKRAFPTVDLSPLVFCAMQTPGDLDRIRRVKGFPKNILTVIGGDWKNLDFKFEKTNLKKRIFDLVLISTHKSEWKFVLPLIQNARGPVVVIPRRLEEAPFFTTQCVGFPDIHVVTEYGKVAEYAAQSQNAVVCGSFCRIGVHNFWEPLRLGCAVWVGHNLRPHEELLKHLIAQGIVGQVGKPFVYNAEKVAAFLDGEQQKMESSVAAFKASLVSFTS
jgi:3-deoxy-D-manno-octulosonic-acid transferase